MERSHAYTHIIDAYARYQGIVAQILEAKAAEAEKSRDWICEYMADGAFGDHKEQWKQAGIVHERLIEVIDGIVKMENGMARNLKLLLNQTEESDDTSSSVGLFGDLFAGGDDPT